MRSGGDGGDGGDVAELSERIAELARLLLEGEGTGAGLAAVARLAAGTVGVESCGITLAAGEGYATAAASDARAEAADQVQYDAGDGPCLTAARTGERVLAADLAEDDRWGSVGRAIAATGVGSSLSVPLLRDGRPAMGALNLYAGRPAAFGDREQELAGLIGALTSILLAAAMRRDDLARLAGQLEQALESRELIAQAIGIVMHERSCPPEEAMAFLRRVSQQSNTPLRVIAGDLVARVAAGPSPGTGPDYSPRARDGRPTA